MNILRRNIERRHIRSGASDMWLSFYPQENDGTSGEGFGGISILNEYLLPSNEDIVSDLVHETELVTYIQKGALALDGPKGNSGVITAGEFQCMTIISVHSQRVTNTSPTDPVRFFRLYLRLTPLQPGVDCAEVQARFTTAERHNVLCTVASPDARKTSLRLASDARVYSSILDAGRHFVYEVPQERQAWLQIVCGKVTANDVDLAEGDGMGVSGEPSISITVKENTELLLVDTVPDSGRA